MYRGKVQEGKKTGRRYGFPTANIALDDAELSGIFAGKARLDGVEYDAVAYANRRRQILEAHLLDFNGNIYGKELEIDLTAKLRDDRSFATEEEARATIAADVEAVRAYFNRG